MASNNTIIDGHSSLISSELSPTEFVKICSNEVLTFEGVKNFDSNENESNSSDSYEIVCESSFSTNRQIEVKENEIQKNLEVGNQKSFSSTDYRSAGDLSLQKRVTEISSKDNNSFKVSQNSKKKYYQDDKKINQQENFFRKFLDKLENDNSKSSCSNTGDQSQRYLIYLIDYQNIDNVRNYSKNQMQQKKLLPSSQMVINGSFGSPFPIVMTEAQRHLITLERSFFCEYYCLITTGVSFLKTNEKTIPPFSKEIFGFYNDIEDYRNALKQFTYLIKNRQKFVLSVDFTLLSPKSQKLVTNNLSGYTCIKCFLNFVPKKRMTKPQFNALVIAYQMAKSPYNWKLCGLTRSKKVTENYGSINANLYDLFISIATKEQNKQMGSVFNKYVQKMKSPEGKYITWDLWKEDFICSVDDIISKSDASFYGWTDPVLKDCALSIRDQTFELYGHLVD